MPNPPLTLYIDIPDPMLHCFIHSIFRPTPNGLMVDSNTATGSVICALTQSTTAKYIYPKTSNTITLILPTSNFNRHLFGKFLHLHPNDAVRVMMVLTREFRLVFSTYMYEALNIGLSKKQAVELFISDHNLTDISTAYETLTKRRQRSSKYAIRNFNQKLRQMSYDSSKKFRKKLHDIK